jgi:hypothetical protein
MVAEEEEEEEEEEEPHPFCGLFQISRCLPAIAHRGPTSTRLSRILSGHNPVEAAAPALLLRPVGMPILVRGRADRALSSLLPAIKDPVLRRSR